MAKGNYNERNKAALAVLADNQLTAQGDELSRVQAETLNQLAAIPRLEREAAARAILAGLGLHKVKASLQFGQFKMWIDQMFTAGKLSQRYNQCYFYMRLAHVFVAKMDVSKPDLLALPGDQSELTLDTPEGETRRFFEKLQKFTDGKSLNELLREHGIKDAPKLGGKRESSDTEAPAQPTPEELRSMKMTEAHDCLDRVKRLLCEENICQFLDKEQTLGVYDRLVDIKQRFADAIKPLIA